MHLVRAPDNLVNAKGARIFRTKNPIFGSIQRLYRPFTAREPNRRRPGKQINRSHGTTADMALIDQCYGRALSKLPLLYTRYYSRGSCFCARGYRAFVSCPHVLVPADGPTVRPGAPHGSVLKKDRGSKRVSRADRGSQFRTVGVS